MLLPHLKKRDHFLMIADMKTIEIIPIAERKLKKRGIKKEWADDAVLKPTSQVSRYWKESKE
jgi:hypothetical protein